MPVEETDGRSARVISALDLSKDLHKGMTLVFSTVYLI